MDVRASELIGDVVATTADKREQGDLSGEQVQRLADAADKTQGASLADATLIDKAASVDPDKGKSVIDDHVADTSSSGKEQSRHDMQRRKRRASRFRTKDGCEASTFAGDRGTIADSVLAHHLGADLDIIGIILGHDGQRLRLGRQARLASLGQIIGLIVRDTGCVLCGAQQSTCQAHHTMPWTSSGRGKTNINELALALALACQDCHRCLCDGQQTLHKDRHTGAWKLRPALPHELAAKRTPRPSDGQAPLLT
ncbi:MAG: hypothetical protein ACKVIQ_00640 [Acidimicrobiales bacterium]